MAQYLSPQHLSVVDIEKGAFGSPPTKFANFTYLDIIDINQYSKNLQNFFRSNKKIVENNFHIYNQTWKKKTYLAFINVTLPNQVAISINLFWHVNKHPFSSYFKFNGGKIYSYTNTSLTIQSII